MNNFPLKETSILFLIFIAAHVRGEGDVVEILEAATQDAAICESHLHEYRLTQSMSCFDRIYSDDQHDLVNAMALQGKAYSYHKMGDRKNAIQFMQQAIHLAQPYDEAALFMARLLAGYSEMLIVEEQFGLAERYLGKAKDFYETYVEILDEENPKTGFLIYEVLGTLYLKTGDLKAARKSVELSVNNAKSIQGMRPFTALLVLAKIELAEGNYDESISLLKQVCDSTGSDPVVVEGCILMARLLIQRNQIDAASRALTTAKLVLDKALWTSDELYDQVEKLVELTVN